MTGFTAEPEAVRALATLLGRQAEHASACDRYILYNTGLEVGEGWLNQLSGAHDVLVDGSRQWFDWLGRYTLEPAEFAVRDAAAYYTSTDAKVAAAFDAQARASSGSPLPNNPSYYFEERARVGAFGEVSDPAGHLTRPEDYSAQEKWRWEMQWTDFLSVGSWGRKVIIEASEILSWAGLIDRPYDPYEFLLKPVTGDWGGLRGCADVFRNTASACRSLSANLHHGRLGIPTVWTGNTADTCDSYISQVCAALEPAAETLEAIADEYQSAAEGAYAFAQAIGNILSELIDSSAKIVAATGAGAMTGPLGWAIGGGIAAWEARRLVKCIESALDIWNTTKAIMDTRQAALQDFGQINASGDILPHLPEAGAPGSPMQRLPE